MALLVYIDMDWFLCINCVLFLICEMILNDFILNMI